MMVGSLSGRSVEIKSGLVGPAASRLEGMQSRLRGRGPDTKIERTNPTSSQYDPEIGCKRGRVPRSTRRKIDRTNLVPDSQGRLIWMQSSQSARPQKRKPTERT